MPCTENPVYLREQEMGSLKGSCNVWGSVTQLLNRSVSWPTVRPNGEGEDTLEARDYRSSCLVDRVRDRRLRRALGCPAAEKKSMSDVLGSCATS
jgi:hypothetical protein